MAAPRRAYAFAGAVLAGAGLWLVAGVLIVWEPGAVAAADVYLTLVPAALLLLAVAFGGLHAWLVGPVPPRPRRSWRAGLTSGLLAMSTRRHESLSATEGHGDGQGLSATRVGVLGMRAGMVVIVAATLMLPGGPDGARSLVNAGWFVFFAGSGVFGVAALASDDAPRWGGALLAAGSLLVFSPMVNTLGGVTRRPGLTGPLLPSPDGGPVPSLLLWILFGGGCAWLGAALLSARRVRAR